MAGMPVEGEGYTAYGNVKKRYTGVWVDNTSTAILSPEGTRRATCGKMGKWMTGREMQALAFLGKLTVLLSSMRIFTLILVLASVVSAREIDSSLTFTVFQDITTTVSDIGYYVTSPLRFDRADWLAAGGVLVGTGVLMSQDKTIHDGMRAEARNSYNGDFWDVPTAVGDFAGAGGLAAVLYGVGLATKSDEVRVTGRLIVESIASAGLTALTVRVLSGRSRPFTGDDSWHFRPMGWTYDHESFPSGHTTTAFALCTVLGERIGTTWSRVGFYSLASLTAFARVRNNQHWPSDVAMGAVLGITAGLQAVGREEGRGDGKESAWRLLAGMDGLTLVYTLP
jgi:membrane-associated phospholipid phosphatase